MKKQCARCGKTIEYKAGSVVSDYCMDCIVAMAAEEAEKQKAEEEAQARETDLFDTTEYKNIPRRGDYGYLIDYCIAFTIAVGASDLHIKSGTAPVIRKGGVLFRVCHEEPTSEEIFAYVKRIVHSAGDIKDTSIAYDFSLQVGKQRFRANAFHDYTGWSIAFRQLIAITGDFKNLHIPEILKQLVNNRSGIILITGPTGSGKSTTLSNVIDYVNHTQYRHIITLEAPIEALHTNHKCIISQREIGRDTASFEEAVVEAMREDPDIIMIGEMRDKGSIEAALRAAETGHIVLSTLHTRGAASSISRIVDIFAPEQQSQIRTQLAMCLLGVVSQQLLPTKKIGTQTLATEVMIVNDAIRSCIRDNKLHFIENTLHTGSNEGMYTMRSSIEQLYNDGIITAEVKEEYMF